MVIPSTSLTQLSTLPWKSVVQNKSEKVLCISIWEPVRNSSLSGIYKMSEQSLKHNIPSGVHSWKLNHKEVHKNMAHCEYNISCVYGRNYAGETTQTASYTAPGAKAESETRSSVNIHIGPVLLWGRPPDRLERGQHPSDKAQHQV